MAKAKGSPKTGGRKVGSRNKTTVHKEQAIAAAGITPLEFMLNIMRGTACPKDADPAVKAKMAEMQFEAAKAAAPYVHPKIGAILEMPKTPEQLAALEGKIEESRSDFEWARRIAFTLNRAARLKANA